MGDEEEEMRLPGLAAAPGTVRDGPGVGRACGDGESVVGGAWWA